MRATATCWAARACHTAAAHARTAGLPVEPGAGGQGHQPLGDPHPQPLRMWVRWRSSPSWAFQGADDALHQQIQQITPCDC